MQKDGRNKEKNPQSSNLLNNFLPKEIVTLDHQTGQTQHFIRRPVHWV
jgi:hypothetical protein